MMTVMMTPIMTKVLAESTWKDLRIFLFGVFATQVTHLVAVANFTNLVAVANFTNLVAVANLTNSKYGTFLFGKQSLYLE